MGPFPRPSKNGTEKKEREKDGWKWTKIRNKDKEGCQGRKMMGMPLNAQDTQIPPLKLFAQFGK